MVAYVVTTKTPPSLTAWSQRTHREMAEATIGVDSARCSFVEYFTDGLTAGEMRLAEWRPFRYGTRLAFHAHQLPPTASLRSFRGVSHAEDGTSRDAPRSSTTGTAAAGRAVRNMFRAIASSATATSGRRSPLAPTAPARVDRGDDVTVLNDRRSRNVWTTCWRTTRELPLHADAMKDPDWHTALVDRCAVAPLPTC